VALPKALISPSSPRTDPLPNPPALPPCPELDPYPAPSGDPRSDTGAEAEKAPDGTAGAELGELTSRSRNALVWDVVECVEADDEGRTVAGCCVVGEAVAGSLAEP